jgi:hypothetical protein
VAAIIGGPASRAFQDVTWFSARAASKRRARPGFHASHHHVFTNASLTHANISPIWLIDIN